MGTRLQDEHQRIGNAYDAGWDARADVTDEMVARFRVALMPGYIVWHDGKRLNDHDTNEQIKRGLLAALASREQQQTKETP